LQNPAHRPVSAENVLNGSKAHFNIAKTILVLVKPTVMKHPTSYGFWLAAITFAVSSFTASAHPVDFGEVSLWVRVHDNESSIRDEISRRKLMHPLTPQQEATLKSQGATDALVQSLRNSNNLASKEEVAAVETSRPIGRGDRSDAGRPELGPRVTVMNVAFGHSINLSQWGGSDYDIAFYSYRSAGEDHIQAAMVDSVRTGTAVSRTIPLVSEGEAFADSYFPVNETRNWRYTPYSASGDLRDNRFNFSDSVAVSSHSFSRPLHIDWDNPVTIDGQPYNFFHVYGAGGVSLYFVGKASDRGATVAVVSDRGL